MTHSLPSVAYAHHVLTGRTILLRRGEPGYSVMVSPERADVLNAQAGVTPQQAAAMVMGSMFGWDAPAASPAEYTVNDARFIIGVPAQEMEAA